MCSVRCWCICDCSCHLASECGDTQFECLGKSGIGYYGEGNAASYRKVYKSHVAENSVNFPGTAVNRKHGTAVFQIIVNIWEDAYANIKQIVFS